MSSSQEGVPKTMRAVRVKDGKGSSGNLYIDDDVDVPTLDKGRVLVKVRAFGLNRMDILQREGQYPLPPGASPILGVEFSGTVAKVGPLEEDDAGDDACPSWHVGQEVFGLATGGAYAEFIAVPARMILAKPASLSWEQAAAIPENFLTAFQALTLLSNVQPNEDVLVHAGASGVGLAAIQLARSLGAAHVYATAGTEDKCRFCESVGATSAINYKATSWYDELARVTNGNGVNVIMDFIGAPYFQHNLDALQRDGRLVMQGAMGGGKCQEVNVASIIFKRLKVEGSTLRSRSLAYQSALVQQFVRSGSLDKIVKGIEGDRSEAKGHHIAIHKVYTWQKIKDAHDEMEANKNTGKIVVLVE